MKMLDYRDYIAYAERLLLLAENRSEQGEDSQWLLIPSVMLSWAAIEFFVNNILDDFSSLPAGIFDLHEKAFLLEKRLRIKNSGPNIGEFELSGSEYRSIEDKIFFLVAKFRKSPETDKLTKGNTLWSKFQKFKISRDALIHPRRNVTSCLTLEECQEYVNAARQIVQLLSLQVWKKKIEF